MCLHRTTGHSFAGPALPKHVCAQVFQFHDHREVEILVRLALRTRGPASSPLETENAAEKQQQQALDPEGVELAEYVIKCGLVQLSKEPFMFVLR